MIIYGIRVGCSAVPSPRLSCGNKGDNTLFNTFCPFKIRCPLLLYQLFHGPKRQLLTRKQYFRHYIPEYDLNRIVKYHKLRVNHCISLFYLLATFPLICTPAFILLTEEAITELTVSLTNHGRSSELSFSK